MEWAYLSILRLMLMVILTKLNNYEGERFDRICLSLVVQKSWKLISDIVLNQYILESRETRI